jgi:hypothetical protein
MFAASRNKTSKILIILPKVSLPTEADAVHYSGRKVSAFCRQRELIAHTLCAVAHLLVTILTGLPQNKT